jgi:hypothetical protein
MNEFVAFTDPGIAWNAVCDFALGPDFAGLDAETKTAIADFLKGDSISFCVSNTAEWMYARRATVPTSAKILGASCAAYCVQNLGVDNVSGDRGVGIMQALRRESGEAAPTGLSWPASSADPEPREAFVYKEPVAPSPPPPMPAPISA